MSRAIKICPPEELENELGVIKPIFLNNVFPALVIDRTILRVRNQLQGTGIGGDLSKNKGDGENNVLLRLPWIGPPRVHYVSRWNSTSHWSRVPKCILADCLPFHEGRGS